MAVLEYKTFSYPNAAMDINIYVSDGHGDAPPDRTNRYVTSGHDGVTRIIGVNCSSDPTVATKEMHLVRMAYERQHPASEGRKKGRVLHVHIFVSFAEGEKLSDEELLAIAMELIEKSGLKGFPVLIATHHNTDCCHFHLSVCPFSLPDAEHNVHKFSVNNQSIYALRRTADRICADRGFSIVENPKLWGDPEFKDWFFKTKAEGRVTIHPPVEENLGNTNRERRKNGYKASKEKQKQEEEEKLAYFQKVTSGYRDEWAQHYWKTPHLYDPASPQEPLRVCTVDRYGRERGELELQLRGDALWATKARDELRRRGYSEDAPLMQEVKGMIADAYQGIKTLKKYDIRTQTELIQHIKEVSHERYQVFGLVKTMDYNLQKLDGTMKAIQRWEETGDSDALLTLQLVHKCHTPEQRAKVKADYAHYQGEKERFLKLYQEKNSEFLELKRAQAILHPAKRAPRWQRYVEQIYGQEMAYRTGWWGTQEYLEAQLRKAGMDLGADAKEVETLLHYAKRVSKGAIYQDYKAFMRMANQSQEYDRIPAIYQEIREQYQDIRNIKALHRKVTVYGPFSLLLWLVSYASMSHQVHVKEQEIAALREAAEKIKAHLRLERVKQRGWLQAAKIRYDERVAKASADEVADILVDFYRDAARILGRYDLECQIEYLQQKGAPVQAIGEMIRHAAEQSEEPAKDTKAVPRQKAWESRGK